MNRHVRAIAGGIASVVAALAIGVAFAAPAQAANFDGNCQGGEVCLYDSINFNPAMADFYNNVSNYGGWHYWNSSVWLDNSVSSVKNQASWSDVILYTNANYSGDGYPLLQGNVNASLGPWGDIFSSHKFFFCGFC
jgi:hypothetical protein